MTPVQEVAAYTVRPCELGLRLQNPVPVTQFNVDGLRSPRRGFEGELQKESISKHAAGARL